MIQTAMGGRVGVRIGAGRRRLSFAAPYRAEDEAAARQERPAQQRSPARVAAEAVIRGMPVLALMSHLTCAIYFHAEKQNGLSFLFPLEFHFFSRK